MTLNDKLRKFRYADIEPKRRRGSGAPGLMDSRLVRLTVSPYKGAKNPELCAHRRNLMITFHSRAIKLTGWQVGDKLSFDYDNGMVLISRDAEGRTLKAPNSSGKGNNSTRPRVDFTLPADVADLFAGKECVDCEAEPGALAFALSGPNGSAINQEGEPS